jgi:hypothetical protein
MLLSLPQRIDMLDALTTAATEIAAGKAPRSTSHPRARLIAELEPAGKNLKPVTGVSSSQPMEFVGGVPRVLAVEDAGVAYDIEGGANEDEASDHMMVCAGAGLAKTVDTIRHFRKAKLLHMPSF